MLSNRSHKATLRTILLLLAALILEACQSTNVPTALSVTSPASTQNTTYAVRKILFVNSYHAGYAWSDGIEQGIHAVLDKTAVNLKFVRMDTKNHSDPQFRRQAGQLAKAEFDSFNPDVVIISDDNAAEYFVLPFLQKSSVPVLYTGINWSAASYNFDKTHIVGMLEVDPIDQMMNNLRPFIKGDRVGYVTIDSETETKTMTAYNERFFNGSMKTYVVKTYQDFKDAFLKAQNENDLVIMGNNAGAGDVWDDSDAIPFFTKNSKVPSGTINSWMTPYALLTVAKIPEEQGEWAARTALRILDGASLSSISSVENKRANLSLNLDIAQQVDVVFTPSMLRNATIYSKAGGK